jgi:hypothetical protein
MSDMEQIEDAVTVNNAPSVGAQLVQEGSETAYRSDFLIFRHFPYSPEFSELSCGATSAIKRQGPVTSPRIVALRKRTDSARIPRSLSVVIQILLIKFSAHSVFTTRAPTNLFGWPFLHQVSDE